MKITDIKVMPVEGDTKLKAFVSIKLEDCFIVRDMKVIHGTNGFFVAMPAKKLKDGTYRDLIHPLDKPTRLKLEEVVLEAYRAKMSMTEEKKPDRHRTHHVADHTLQAQL